MPLTPIKLNALHPFPNEPSLQGDRRRVAFVTGAARGIGEAIALQLAKDGLDIAINDIMPGSLVKTKELVESTGARCVELYGNAANENEVASMVDQIVTELNYLDVMVSGSVFIRAIHLYMVLSLPTADE